MQLKIFFPFSKNNPSVLLNGDVIPLADVPWLYDFVRSPRDGNRNQNNLNILKIVMTVAAPARAPINCCFIFQIFISIFCERERERETKKVVTKRLITTGTC